MKKVTLKDSNIIHTQYNGTRIDCAETVNHGRLFRLRDVMRALDKGECTWNEYVNGYSHALRTGKLVIASKEDLYRVRSEEGPSRPYTMADEVTLSVLLGCMHVDKDTIDSIIGAPVVGRGTDASKSVDAHTETTESHFEDIPLITWAITYTCPVCHKESSTPYNYCPHCGRHLVCTSA